MTAEPPELDLGNSLPDSLILEIGLEPGEVPLRLPVAVQNYASGLITLKITQPVTWVEWEILSGRDSLLRLPSPYPEETSTIDGKVSWIKKSGRGEVSIFLGMELAQATPQVDRLLEEQVLHTPMDMKDLWHQWDEFQVKSRRATVANVIILVLGLGLFALGVALLVVATKFPKVYGYVPLAVGVLLTFVAAARFWWQRRV